MLEADSTGKKTPLDGLGGNLMNQSMADNESAWGIGESFLASGGIQMQGDERNLHKPMYQLSQDGEDGEHIQLQKPIKNNPSNNLDEMAVD